MSKKLSKAGLVIFLKGLPAETRTDMRTIHERKLAELSKTIWCIHNPATGQKIKTTEGLASEALKEIHE